MTIFANSPGLHHLKCASYIHHATLYRTVNTSESIFQRSFPHCDCCCCLDVAEPADAAVGWLLVVFAYTIYHIHVHVIFSCNVIPSNALCAMYGVFCSICLVFVTARVRCLLVVVFCCSRRNWCRLALTIRWWCCEVTAGQVAGRFHHGQIPVYSLPCLMALSISTLLIASFRRRFDTNSMMLCGHYVLRKGRKLAYPINKFVFTTYTSFIRSAETFLSHSRRWRALTINNNITNIS